MKVEIKFDANLEEPQDLEMARKICQVIGANPVTVKTTDVKKSVPAQDVKKPAPAPVPKKTEESEPMPMDANSSLGSDPAVSIQDIRTLLASKVDNHRETIRAKLTELGAKMGAPNHSSRKHAMLSASKADRWINCTPSARLEEKVEETGKPSKYAEEGTLAHEMAECYLRARFRITPVDVTSAELRKLKKSDLYTEAMDEPVMAYCQYVTDQYTEALRKTKDALVLLEERLDFSAWVEQGFGTGDACIIADGVMEIIDLKFGTGVPVFAENNAQLMLYALGALSKFEMVYDINMVKLTIVQPRQDRISSWEITPEDLYKWGEEVVKPKAALAYSGDGELQVGHWCRWCRVKALCRKMADHNLDLAKHEFKEPELLTTEELAQIFEQAPMLQDWVNAVSEHLLSKAISGEKVPGYKVVEGRSMRKWTDENAVQEVLTACDYTPEQFQVVKLAGIPAIEKLLKKDFDSLVGDLVIKAPGKPTLVPESDKRPAMGIEQAKLDFSNN